MSLSDTFSDSELKEMLIEQLKITPFHIGSLCSLLNHRLVLRLSSSEHNYFTDIKHKMIANNEFKRREDGTGAWEYVGDRAFFGSLARDHELIFTPTLREGL